MSTNVGDLKVKLTLEGSEWKLTVEQARRALRQLETQLDATGKSVSRIETHLTSAATKFRHTIMTIGALRFALMDIQDIFLALPGAVIRSGAEIERMTMLMKGLSKQATDSARTLEAQKNTQFVFDIALNAPFEVKAIQDAFVKLKTGGIDPTNGSLKALVDSVAKFGGSTDQMKRASIAIQQMAGKGVISMEELRQQLGEAVPNALQLMAKGTNMTMAQLVNAISKGTVESRDALNRLFLMMRLENDGAAKSMMQTMAGLQQNFLTRWELMKNSIANAGFMQAVKEVMTELNAAFENPAVKQFALDVGRGLGEAVKMLASLGRWLAENIELIKNIGIGLVAAFAGTRALGAIANLGNAIRGYAIEAISETRKIQAANATRVFLEIAEERSALTAKQAALQQNVAAHRAAYTAKLIEHRKYLVELAALEATAAANAMNKGRSALVRPNPMLAAQTAADIAKTKQLIAETERLRNIQKDQIIWSSAQAREIGKVADAKGVAAQKALEAGKAFTFATGALSAGRFLWSLVGGGLGAIALALTIGIPLWLQYANAVEKANEASREAAETGNATEKIIANQEAAIKKFQERVEVAERALAAATMDGSSAKTIDQLAGQLIKAQNDLAEAERNIGKNREDLIRINGDRIARQITQNVEKEIEALKNAETALIAQSAEQRLRAAEEIKDQKARAQEILKIESETKLKQLDLQKKILEALKRNRATLAGTEGGDKAQNLGFAKAIKDLNQQIASTIDFIQQLDKTFNSSTTLITPEKKGADKKSPFERWIAQTQKSTINAQQDIRQIVSGLDEAADLKQIAEQKIDDLMEAGTLTGKDGARLTDAQRDLAIGEEVLRMRAEMAKTGIKKLIDAVSEGEEELRQAMTKFSAPENFAVTTKVFAADKLTADLKKNMPQIIAELDGGAAKFEEFMQRIYTAAASADIAQFLAKIKQDVQSINDSMFVNEEERAKTLANRQIAIADASARRQIEIQQTMLLQRTINEQQFSANVLQIEQSTAELRAAINKKLAFDLRTPMQRLYEDWTNMGRNMQQAYAQWTSQFVDTFVEGIRQGKFEWGDFVEQLLADLLKMYLRMLMISSLKSAGLFPFAEGGVMSGTGPVEFAKGGIMSAAGKVPMRAYSVGGIARSPQIAMFGEGSRPEAYVPLPDGKTIPVTMDGGAPNVQVNVYNQTGQETTAKTNSRFDGKNLILDVVLSAVNQAGPFRDGLRQAVR